MARFAVGVVFGLVVGVVAGAAAGLHADPRIDDDTASEAIPEAPAPVLNPVVERRLNCIAYYESKNYAGAVNRSSGASGLFQFLPSTWRTTPQGRAGLSVFDPIAARSAARWMLEQGRAREWTVVQRGLC